MHIRDLHIYLKKKKALDRDQKITWIYPSFLTSELHISSSTVIYLQQTAFALQFQQSLSKEDEYPCWNFYIMKNIYDLIFVVQIKKHNFLGQELDLRDTLS